MVRSYLKAALWEYPLCALCSAALAWTLFQGFYLPEALAGSAPLTALLALLFQGAFLLFGYSRRTAALGVCCWAPFCARPSPFWPIPPPLCRCSSSCGPASASSAAGPTAAAC